VTLPDGESFVHRANSDGTMDSICKRCFVTVCTSVWEAKLAFEERKHVCDRYALARFGKDSERKGNGIVK
jgi:hypothetical protein